MLSITHSNEISVPACYPAAARDLLGALGLLLTHADSALLTEEPSCANRDRLVACTAATTAVLAGDWKYCHAVLQEIGLWQDSDVRLTGASEKALLHLREWHRRLVALCDAVEDRLDPV